MAPTPFATPPNTDLVLDNTPHVAAQCTLIHCSTLQHTATHCNAPRGRHGINPTCHTSCYPMRPRPHPTRCSTMHSNTLQHTATHCNALQRTSRKTWHQPHLPHLLLPNESSTTPHTLQHNELQHTTAQCAATHCNALQHTATHCNALQRTATHCNTPRGRHGIKVVRCASQQ